MVVADRDGASCCGGGSRWLGYIVSLSWEKIDEKEREIGGFREKVQELESLVAKNGADLEKWMREKLGLEESLRKSDEKAKLGTTKMDFTVHIRVTK
ncbi:peroxisomal and mitochondrial division factor 2-like isoform X2 [Quercus suber]|uniref:peroxisomal and mitochondrial division factor 2-like isoform X2 n=1 Tax=Quercus suber TaxID=58331 RepID=UPI0032DF8C53